MKIKINGNEESVEASEVTVSQLLEIKKVDMPDMVTVELNEEIIDRDKYATQLVKENDAIEFLYFMGGGN